MDAEFWLKRWQEGRIGWHHAEVMPLLEKHWPALGVQRGECVLVPLSGKSLDILWLARQGMQVLGVELSAIAVESFLAENGLRADTVPSPAGPRYTIANPPDGSIAIVNGDIFEVDATVFADCAAFYDRAATIALPPASRERLARQVYARLPRGSRGLLITLDYPAGEMEGPPFSVDDREVHRLFDADWRIDELERRDILASQPDFVQRGVSVLQTAVYRLARR